jgi:hypothetical protein
MWPPTRFPHPLVEGEGYRKLGELWEELAPSIRTPHLTRSNVGSDTWFPEPGVGGSNPSRGALHAGGRPLARTRPTSVAWLAVNQMKNRLQALAQLDRALQAMTDAELEALIAALPEDHREAIDELCEARDGGFADPAARTVAIRATVARGRMSGDLERIATVLTDVCLADCIEKLGEASDNPSEDELQAILPDVIETHGLATVRLTLAASVAGEAAASIMLTRLLKHDEVVAIPVVAEAPAPLVVLTREADDETKARRKAAKERKQAESRARREQQAKARHRV